jgi:hypothetical protein
MKIKTILAALSLAVLAAFISPAIAADTAQPAAPGQPNAETILKQMSDKLGAARQFSFKATREISSSVAEQHNLQAKSDVEVTVQRPNSVAGTSTNADTTRRLYFDGKNLTVVDGKENTCSVTPMKASLDTLPVQLATKYGFVPPLADFVISDPYKDMKFRAQSISYAGTDTIGSPAVECHHLKLSGKIADSDLWIAVSDNLPRKMTAKVKGGSEAGEDLTIEFTEWNMDAPVTGDTFVFTPPADSQKIPMVTLAEAQTADQEKGKH